MCRMEVSCEFSPIAHNCLPPWKYLTREYIIDTCLASLFLAFIIDHIIFSHVQSLQPPPHHYLKALINANSVKVFILYAKHFAIFIKTSICTRHKTSIEGGLYPSTPPIQKKMCISILLPTLQ